VRQKHQVEISEVEYIFDNKSDFRFVKKGHRPNENVYAALGQTSAGPYLITLEP
jgi:uncharacterized DUF497 family protein